MSHFTNAFEGLFRVPPDEESSCDRQIPDLSQFLFVHPAIEEALTEELQRRSAGATPVTGRMCYRPARCVCGKYAVRPERLFK